VEAIHINGVEIPDKGDVLETCIMYWCCLTWLDKLDEPKLISDVKSWNMTWEEREFILLMSILSCLLNNILKVLMS